MIRLPDGRTLAAGVEITAHRDGRRLGRFRYVGLDSTGCLTVADRDRVRSIRPCEVTTVHRQSRMPAPDPAKRAPARTRRR